MKQSFSNG